jgi:hypothetical protein
MSELKETIKIAQGLIDDSYDSEEALEAFEQIIELTEKMPLISKDKMDIECLIMELISVMPNHWVDKYMKREALEADFDLEPSD